jgi:quinol monooxygenase YgiN
MYSLLVEITVAPTDHDAYVAALTAHAARCLANEPGTLQFDLIQDDSDPNRLCLYERYADQAAVAAHGQGESMRLQREVTRGLTATTRVIRGEVLNAG